MFRPLSRVKQQLSHEKCLEILKTETRGVLSVCGDDGYPYGMPMNHWYDERDGYIYFHCGRNGHRIDALKKCGKVSFCVYDRGERNDGEWAYRVNSVIVFGIAEIIDDMGIVTDITARLCRKFTSDEQYIAREIESYAKETLLIRLVPQSICGKSVKEE